MEVPQKSNTSQILTESHLLRLEESLKVSIERLECGGPFALTHNADFALGRLCYLICRDLAPATVLETGVAYGVTSAFILQALALNGKGRLLSVDLPPLGREADTYVGALIPQDLRNRWELRRGPSKRILPILLPSVGSIDVFVYDSLHTYRNMILEFETIWPYLRPGGALIADDVADNPAFVKFANKVGPCCWTLVRKQNQDSVFGVLLKAP